MTTSPVMSVFGSKIRRVVGLVIKRTGVAAPNHQLICGHVLNAQRTSPQPAEVQPASRISLATQRETTGHVDQARRASVDCADLLAHEVSQPLTAARLALEHYATDPALHGASMLKLAQRSLEQACSVVQRRGQPSAAAAGSRRPDSCVHDDFDVGEFFGWVCQIWSLSATQAGLSLRRHVEVPGRARLSFDRVALAQILDNLLGNACKYTRQGHIELRAWLSDARAQSPARHAGEVSTPEPMWLHVSVSDTGCGMAQAELERLREPYARGAASIGHVHGSGIGLTACDLLLQSMGGTMCIDSPAGYSTRITLRVPVQGIDNARQPDLQSATPTEQHELAALRPGVVVVDDDSVSQIVIAAMLHTMGAGATCAGTLHEAVDLVARGHAAGGFVLCDEHLAEGYGHQLVGMLRGNLQASRSPIPIVAMTGALTASTREALLRAGMSDVVAKPLCMQTLEQLLHRYAGMATLHQERSS